MMENLEEEEKAMVRSAPDGSDNNHRTVMKYQPRILEKVKRWHFPPEKNQVKWVQF